MSSQSELDKTGQKTGCQQTKVSVSPFSQGAKLPEGVHAETTKRVFSDQSLFPKPPKTCVDSPRHVFTTSGSLSNHRSDEAALPVQQGGVHCRAHQARQELSPGALLAGASSPVAGDPPPAGSDSREEQQPHDHGRHQEGQAPGAARDVSSPGDSPRYQGHRGGASFDPPPMG